MTVTEMLVGVREHLKQESYTPRQALQDALAIVEAHDTRPGEEGVEWLKSLTVEESKGLLRLGAMLNLAAKSVARLAIPSLLQSIMTQPESREAAVLPPAKFSGLVS